MTELHEGCMTAGIGCIDCKKKLMAHLEEMMGRPGDQRPQVGYHRVKEGVPVKPVLPEFHEDEIVAPGMIDV